MTERKEPADIANPRSRLRELEYRVRRRSGPDLWSDLVGALDDPYGPIRTFAARALAENAADELTPVAAALVHGRPERARREARRLEIPADPPQPAPGVRQAACRILGGSSRREATQTLLTAAEDGDSDVRYAALVGLHETETDAPELRETVAERLEDDDPEVAAVAAQFVAEHDWTGLVEPVREAWRRENGGARLHFALTLAELRRDHSGVLEETTVDGLTDELVEALDDEETVAAACRGLVALGAERSRGALRGVLDRWFVHPLLRCEAAAALVELGDRRGREYLADALEHRRRDVRGWALRSVGRLELSTFAGDLHDLARSEDYHADTALLALGDWDDERARSTLQAVRQNHTDDSIRDLAERILGRLRITGDFDPDRFDVAME